MNTDKPTTAVGHTFYNSSYEDAGDVLARVGSELEDGGFSDFPEAYGSNFKITVTVEAI